MAYSPEAISLAVTNGLRSIEHGNLLDEPTARLMAERNAVLVPTLVTYRAMAEHGKALGMASVWLEKNALVLEAGKGRDRARDAVGRPRWLRHPPDGRSRERATAGAGGPAHEVQGTLELLRSVTSRNAAILGDDRYGRIGIGAAADVLIVGGDPFSTPEVLRQPATGRRVVKAGVVVA